MPCPGRRVASPPSGGTTPRATPKSSAMPRRPPNATSPPCRGRASGGGNIMMVPQQGITVGPAQTWQAGVHDNPLDQRLPALRTCSPMTTAYHRGGLGAGVAEMH